MLRVENISKRFGAQEVLHGVTFEADYGQVWVLLGPNGAGKSTLFNIISGFLKPTSGSAVLDGRSLTDLPAERVAAQGLRKVFQTTKLWESLSIRENVLVACEGMSKEHTKTAVARALELTGLGPASNRLPSALSAGQRRILAISLALVSEPRVLLLDEPSAALDPINAARVFDYVREIDLSSRLVLLVEHNLHLLQGFGSHAIFMHRGKVLATGPFDEVASRPDLREVYLGLATE